MRKTTTISLSSEMLDFIKSEVKIGGFANASEFLRCLVRAYKDEKMLCQQLMQSKQAVAKGQGFYSSGQRALSKDQLDFAA